MQARIESRVPGYEDQRNPPIMPSLTTNPPFAVPLRNGPLESLHCRDARNETARRRASLVTIACSKGSCARSAPRFRGHAIVFGSRGPRLNILAQHRLAAGQRGGAPRPQVLRLTAHRG